MCLLNDAVYQEGNMHLLTRVYGILTYIHALQFPFEDSYILYVSVVVIWLWVLINLRVYMVHGM